jgi:hypothetical protein
MIFCARATRGLRRMERERPGALLARRTRTMKRCSFDARSKGQPWPLPYREVKKIGKRMYVRGSAGSPGKSRMSLFLGPTVRTLELVSIATTQRFNPFGHS